MEIGLELGLKTEKFPLVTLLSITGCLTCRGTWRGENWGAESGSGMLEVTLGEL